MKLNINFDVFTFRSGEGYDPQVPQPMVEVEQGWVVKMGDQFYIKCSSQQLTRRGQGQMLR